MKEVGNRHERDNMERNKVESYFTPDTRLFVNIAVKHFHIDLSVLVDNGLPPWRNDLSITTVHPNEEQ